MPLRRRIEMLLQAGAIINMKDKLGNILLHFLYMSDHLLHFSFTERKTPLEWAETYEYTESAQCLKEWKGSKGTKGSNMTNGSGTTKEVEAKSTHSELLQLVKLESYNRSSRTW